MDVEGRVEPGFEPVVDAFVANFREHGDIGASCAVSVGGRTVVDIWGGVADVATERPWTREHARSSSSPRRRARPRSARNLLVAARPARPRRAGRLLLARVRGERQGRHPGALGALPPGRPRRDRGRRSPSTRRSRGTRSWRRSPPSRRTGSRARRTATTSARTAGSSASSCGASTAARSVGSSPTRSPRRSASTSGSASPRRRSRGSRQWCHLSRATDPAAQALFEQFAGPDTFLGRTLTGPSGLFHYDEMWNTRAIHAAELPSSNGIADARSVARMYAATVGAVDGVRLLEPATVAAATVEQVEGPRPGGHVPDAIRARLHARRRRSPPVPGRTRSVMPARAGRSASPTPTASSGSGT